MEVVSMKVYVIKRWSLQRGGSCMEVASMKVTVIKRWLYLSDSGMEMVYICSL